MKLLVFGRSGQVARALAGVHADAVFLGRADADLADAQACAALVARADADAIVNAAAYTDVDRAETDEATARAVNARAPAAMARAAAARGLPFVHLSTDYVFSGRGSRPFAPDDETAPLNAYGRTKREGEIGVREAGGVHAVIRTSWVFSARGANFVHAMLRLSRTRDAVRVVADQIGGPTPAEAIARAIVRVAACLAEDGSASGTYHFAGAPDVSRADFARAILAEAGRAVRVEEVASADYPTPARRPLNSRLCCATMEARFRVTRPDWRAGLGRVLRETGAVS